MSNFSKTCIILDTHTYTGDWIEVKTIRIPRLFDSEAIALSTIT